MIQLEKQRLRDEAGEILRGLPVSAQGSASATSRALLESWPVWQTASSVCAFCALFGEPDLLTPWPEKKAVALPRVEGGELSMRCTSSANELSRGRFGILEPSAAALESPGGWDLILVPGLAFDRNGGRLGRGRGYYDRFLSRHHEAFRVGVCFDEQIVDAVPCEAHDLRMHALLTPSTIMAF